MLEVIMRNNSSTSVKTILGAAEVIVGGQEINQVLCLENIGGEENDERYQLSEETP